MYWYTQGGETKTAYLRFVKFFLSMQMSIISILISICVWLLLTVVEIAKKNVGISIVLVATFYTMLMLVSHGEAAVLVEYHSLFDP